MTALSRATQLTVAARNYENDCDCCDDDADLAKRIDALIEQYKTDPMQIARADGWTDGTQSDEHYSDLESAMADLHFIDPSDLLGSDVLVRLYQLARIHGEARLAQFREMAEQELAA